jgi:hypothetical protein
VRCLADSLKFNQKPFREKYVNIEAVRRLIAFFRYFETVKSGSRGKSPIMGRFPNMGKCIISYQKVLRSTLKNVNH